MEPIFREIVRTFKKKTQEFFKFSIRTFSKIETLIKKYLPI